MTKLIQSSYFTLRYRPNPAAPVVVAVRVPKRVSAQAVRRNRSKRQLKAIFQTLTKTMRGWDAVVVASPPILGKGYGEIKRQAEASIKKISVNP